ncbi:hypothetical protein VULLAG_LOCUS6517 [Vulpes lagopus]
MPANTVPSVGIASQLTFRECLNKWLLSGAGTICASPTTNDCILIITWVNLALWRDEKFPVAFFHRIWSLPPQPMGSGGEHQQKSESWIITSCQIINCRRTSAHRVPVSRTEDVTSK